MGMGSNQNQVYFDPNGGGYYTYAGPYDIISNRNYLNQRTVNQNPTPSSNISNLVQQAMNAQANPTSMAQLFPYMNYGANTGGLGGLLGMTGQYGAGRFLGGNAMGNTGMTSNAMNTM